MRRCQIFVRLACGAMSVNNRVASAISTSSRHAHTFIANSCSIAGCRTSIPSARISTGPWLNPIRYPFAASLSQSSGHPYSPAIVFTYPRTMCASGGGKKTASISCVDGRALYPSTIAAPPTTTIWSVYPCTAAICPRRSRSVVISCRVSNAISVPAMFERLSEKYRFNL